MTITLILLPLLWKATDSLRNSSVVNPKPIEVITLTNHIKIGNPVSQSKLKEITSRRHKALTVWRKNALTAIFEQNSLSSGAHHKELATTPYSCHITFTDRSIFSLNLSRIQTPTETSVTNFNHKHELMLTSLNEINRLKCRWWCVTLGSKRLSW